MVLQGHHPLISFLVQEDCQHTPFLSDGLGSGCLNRDWNFSKKEEIYELQCSVFLSEKLQKVVMIIINFRVLFCYLSKAVSWQYYETQNSGNINLCINDNSYHKLDRTAWNPREWMRGSNVSPQSFSMYCRPATGSKLFYNVCQS